MPVDTFASLAYVYCSALRCSLDATLQSISQPDACLPAAAHRGQTCSSTNAWIASLLLGLLRTGLIKQSCAQDLSILISQYEKVTPEPVH
jgi:hypothetical protein